MRLGMEIVSGFVVAVVSGDGCHDEDLTKEAW